MGYKVDFSKSRRKNVIWPLPIRSRRENQEKDRDGARKKNEDGKILNFMLLCKIPEWTKKKHTNMIWMYGFRSTVQTHAHSKMMPLIFV